MSEQQQQQAGVQAGQWVVGVDLRPESAGAVRFGTWLARGGRARLVGVHVIEEDQMQPALRYHHLDDILASAEEATRSIIDNLGAARSFNDVVVVSRQSADRALAEAITSRQASGLVIGRHAGTKRRTLVRLGRVARRLLRQAEVPTIVVPPDLEALGSGPVIVATNLQGDCAHAAAFGQRLAGELGRPVLFAHTVASPEDYGSHYLPGDVLERIYTEHQQAAERELEAWIGEHGFARGEQVVLQGSTIERLIELAQERDAAAIVTGSRRLSGLERLFLTSVGTEMAASAPCAVAVVPPQS